MYKVVSYGLRAKCQAGQYLDVSSLTCVLCAANTYSSTGASVCFNCPEGMVSGTGASSCIQCEPGLSLNAQRTACVNCVAGTWSSVANAELCITCNAGTWSSSDGATSSLTCMGCNAGTWSSSSGATSGDTCISCNAGMWTPGLGTLSSSLCFQVWSCRDILAIDASAIDGIYSITQAASSATSTYCLFVDSSLLLLCLGLYSMSRMDASFDGGGWQMCYTTSSTVSHKLVNHIRPSSFVY